MGIPTGRAFGADNYQYFTFYIWLSDGPLTLLGLQAELAGG